MDDYSVNPLPMINETNIRNFIGRYAILHGKVSSIRNNTLFLCLNPDSSVSTDISVKNFNQVVKIGNNIKVIGKIYGDMSVEFLDFYNLSDEFDLKLVNDSIPILHNKEVSTFFF